MPSETSEILTGKRSELNHDTKVLVNMIFARFHHIYTHRFESAYRDETTLNQAKREWAMSLSGTSTDMVELALERCKHEHAWPPTIAEFLKLMQPAPESLGLPDTLTAYLEACRNSYQATGRRWSHICVKAAAMKVSYFSLRSEPERLTKPLFEKAYLDLVHRISQGETIQVAEPVALPLTESNQAEELISQLINAGVDDKLAPAIAYYSEKPAGSATRHRYRERAQQQLLEMKIAFDLPE
ncbi:replication protein P [Reinekea thalattae]|uniref:Uncharacterized protein n=1 Tax=Reinekea thalattae TaxID=2593301 RepID=A0A5C8Z8Q3_9GAMM|nr:replication protein P [Reinekea thalattae]TXR54312.1 hypothetical protein FME95_07185 [Reinekea thalattae]